MSYKATAVSFNPQPASVFDVLKSYKAIDREDFNDLVDEQNEKNNP
jgi:hypothetical protein